VGGYSVAIQSYSQQKPLAFVIASVAWQSIRLRQGLRRDYGNKKKCRQKPTTVLSLDVSLVVRTAHLLNMTKKCRPRADDII